MCCAHTWLTHSLCLPYMGLNAWLAGTHIRCRVDASAHIRCHLGHCAHS